jgi:hypothetical protein
MDYEVIPDFLYLNEPIYRRVTGVPQARLVSSGIGHAVNVEPIDNNQHGVYPWSASAGPASSTTNANSTYSDRWRNRGTISSADGEHLVRLCYRAEDVAEALRSVLDPANANRVYYRQRLGREFLRLGTLVRHFLRTGDRDVHTQFFFSDEPDRSYPVSSLFYDPFQFLRPTTAPAPVIGLPTQGGYKRSTTTTSRNKKKLIRRSAASRKRR